MDNVTELSRKIKASNLSNSVSLRLLKGIVRMTSSGLQVFRTAVISPVVFTFFLLGEFVRFPSFFLTSSSAAKGQNDP